MNETNALNASAHIFIIAGTLGSLLVFFLILQFNRTSGHANESTGHNYDGIEELDNPLPSWWYWMFVLSIIFSLGYLVVYPGLGNYEGIAGWSSMGQLEDEQEVAEARYGPLFASYREIPINELALQTEAVNMGKRLFANNCAVCHGAAAQGSVGFPNLHDEEWLWGDTETNIEATILNGRNAAMPAWGTALGEAGVAQVAEYVVQLSGREADTSMAEAGKARYMTFCVACHGAEGKGQPVLGAPDLTNNIWLYGASREALMETIANGRNGQMPAFAEKLGEDKVHILAAFVKSLQ